MSFFWFYLRDIYVHVAAAVLIRIKPEEREVPIKSQKSSPSRSVILRPEGGYVWRLVDGAIRNIEIVKKPVIANVASFCLRSACSVSV